MAFSSAEAAQPRRGAAAAWILSALFHLLLVLGLGRFLEAEPRGIAREPHREFGVVLKRLTPEGETYEGEEETSAPSDSDQQTDSIEEVSGALARETADLDPRDALPSLAGIGPVAPPGSQVGDVRDLTRGAAQPATVRGGKAQVSVYGLTGEGRKFVYVFDRSLSMTGPPLASAKRQLIDSLQALDETHQFQILFFNRHPRVFDISGGQGRIPFASDRAKSLAAKFVGGIIADGGTDRYGALIQAIGMHPDVIFFLTDADDPMSALEIERVRRKNKERSTIHTIQFGVGPFSGEETFLHRIAHASGGQWAYVDTSKL